MERVFGAADQISHLLFENGLKNVDFSWVLLKGGIAVAIIAAVIALLMLLAGVKCKYFLFALQGFFTGITAGLAVCWFLNLDRWLMIVIPVVAGILLAAFEAVFRHFGMFVFSFVTIFASVLALAGERGYIIISCAAVIALVFAVLATIFGDPMIIPVMGIGGGVLGGIVVSRYVPYDSILVFYGASLVLAIIGICIQYAVKSSKIAKMERKKVREIRARKSVESEVEMARNMLDSSDTESEEDH